MPTNRKATGLLFLLSLVVITTAATIGSNGKYKNLKILPQDISEKKLDSIMNAYNKALSVSCDFCHIKPKKDLFSLTPVKDEIDFALDNPMKEEARKMIQLQMDINTKYFYNDSTIKPQYLNVVGCNTCHRGNPYPAYE
ncbi:MAG: c-type cytochrome [Sphingobacteriaceae bacterium]|nr:MAG: c-type cytochrome [Sphingobacteriaceae bacterium]